MSYKVNKVIYLLLGMVLGFFVGGGIIWWQIQNKNDSDKKFVQHYYSKDKENQFYRLKDKISYIEINKIYFIAY